MVGQNIRVKGEGVLQKTESRSRESQWARKRQSFYLSESDSDVFGFPVARVYIDSNVQIGSALEFATENKAKLVILRCPAHSSNLINELCSLGFLFMENLIYYRCVLAKTFARAPKSDITIRYGTADDCDSLTAITYRSFREYTSHYHQDSRLPHDLSTQVYVRWAERALLNESPKERILLAEQQGRILGFGLVRMNSARQGEAVLAGVDPDCGVSGTYVHRSLLLRGMRHAFEHGATQGLVSTQITNMLVQRVWTRLGWEPTNVVSTFHFWL